MASRHANPADASPISDQIQDKVRPVIKENDNYDLQADIRTQVVNGELCPALPRSGLALLPTGASRKRKATPR